MIQAAGALTPFSLADAIATQVFREEHISLYAEILLRVP